MSTETRTLILETARRLFIQQGFTATSIRQLAQETGIGKATIYHHFAEKQAIAMALLDQELDVDEGVITTLHAESDPRRRIEISVRTSLAFFRQSMNLIQVVRREVPVGQARLDAEFNTYWESHTALIAAAITQGQTEGAFRAMDAEQAAQVLIAMIFGLVNSAVALNQPIPTPEEGTAVLLDIFWRGIEK